jgi:hypothetical protein
MSMKMASILIAETRGETQETQLRFAAFPYVEAAISEVRPTKQIHPALRTS